jgi:NAD(P)-dependent dehydrogenase (short-subunit alcohol dehydrogenase family)
VLVVHPTVVRDLEGKVALVTGATSGIGRAAAVQLAAQGATVVVHGRDVTRGVAVVAEIENAGGTARFVGADLGEPAEALRLAEEVGDVDILVNNAGFAWFGPSAKLAVNTLDRLFAANVQAPYLLASILAPTHSGRRQARRQPARPAVSVEAWRSNSGAGRHTNR